MKSGDHLEENLGIKNKLVSEALEKSVKESKIMS